MDLRSVSEMTVCAAVSCMLTADFRLVLRSSVGCVAADEVESSTVDRGPHSEADTIRDRIRIPGPAIAPDRAPKLPDKNARNARKKTDALNMENPRRKIESGKQTQTQRRQLGSRSLITSPPLRNRPLNRSTKAPTPWSALEPGSVAPRAPTAATRSPHATAQPQRTSHGTSPQHPRTAQTARARHSAHTPPHSHRLKTTLQLSDSYYRWTTVLPFTSSSIG